MEWMTRLCNGKYKGTSMCDRFHNYLLSECKAGNVDACILAQKNGLKVPKRTDKTDSRKEEALSDDDRDDDEDVEDDRIHDTLAPAGAGDSSREGGTNGSGGAGGRNSSARGGAGSGAGGGAGSGSGAGSHSDGGSGAQHGSGSGAHGQWHSWWCRRQ